MARGRASETLVYVALLSFLIAPFVSAQSIPGDINDDGVVNAVDVQLAINGALGLDIGDANADINGDNVVNAIDVQLVINAALGFPIDPGGTVTGNYDPVNGLQLMSSSLTLTIPGGALDSPTQITMKKAGAGDLPVAVPGAAGLAGGVFGPDGLVFNVPAEVEVTLGGPTVARALPVLTFDDSLNQWVGTGENATVGDDGISASFEAEHFSIAGLPDPVPIPDPGDTPGSFIVLSNDGALETDAISSTGAALLYSEFGVTFSISATSQSLNMEGQLETKAIGLTSIAVFIVENYVVGVVGGPTSLFDPGGVPEPALGVMVMSVQGQQVSLSLYVATENRVIHGTLTGTMQ